MASGDIGGDVGLGAAGLEKLGYPGVHPVDRRAGGAQRLDLGRVLTIRKPAMICVPSTGTAPNRGGQRQQMQRGHRVGHRGPRMPASASATMS